MLNRGCVRCWDYPCICGWDNLSKEEQEIWWAEQRKLNAKYSALRQKEEEIKLTNQKLREETLIDARKIANKALEKFR